MSSTATVLILFAFLLGESFAGYSTGFRRTPKPKNPETVAKPVVYPVRAHPVKEDPLWDGQRGISVEEDKIDGEEGISKTDGDGKDGTDTVATHQIDKNPEEDTKEIGSNPEPGGLWVPSSDDLPTEEKEVQHEFPELPHKEDTSVKLDDKTVEEDKLPPHSEEEILPNHPNIPNEEEQQPFIPDQEDGSIDLPGKLPEPHPDTQKTDEDEEVPLIPNGGSHEIPPEKPSKEDESDVVPGGGADYDYKGTNENVPPVVDEGGIVGIGPLPDQDVPPGDVVVIPPGIKTEVLEPYPMKVGNGNINLYELMEKLELSRFLHLVEEANLKDLLTAEGPLTIFAPSDYALSRLNAETIRKLATNQELLRQFVLYHLVDGQIYGSSFDERDNSAMITKSGGTIHINRYGSSWFVNGIPITIRDQTCRNGVIHVLDRSLYPFPTGDLLETLEQLENFKIYTELIRNAKLDRELIGNAVYTIFVPTDAAFSKLPPANLEWLKWDIPAIKRMFRQLTVSGTYYTTWMPSSDGQLSSIDGETKLSLSGYPDAVNVNGVPLSQHDITASNGCIHAIDDIWFLSELGTPSSGSSKKKD